LLANINYRDKKTGKMRYPHTLNSTAIPTSRAICAILENFQTEDGRVLIPKILRRYLEPYELAPKDEIIPRK
jgi:seryl-tRNA synthetase